VGGSALDAVTARQGEDPAGITTVALSFQWANFERQLTGSGSVDSSGTERLDATLFDLALWHHLPKGFAAGVRIPIGSVRVVPDGGQPAFVSGFGDIQLSGAYNLHRLWAHPWRPRLTLRASLALPSGEAKRVEDAAPGVPPNLIAIGTGAIGGGVDARLTQPIREGLSVRAWGGIRTPFSYSETGNKFGWSATYGLGLLYQPVRPILLAADFFGVHLDQARSREAGLLINSGGDSMLLDLGATYLATDRVALGVTVRAPIFQQVNGTQIAQSFGLMSVVAVSFGKDAEEHDHGGEDKHDHGAEGEDKHDHGAEGEDKHDHGAEGEDKHDHGQHGSSHAPDVADLATGGSSFALKSAAVAGKRVAIDFWAEWCKPCKKIEKLLHAHAASHPDFAVRKVEVPTAMTDVARDHLGGKPKLPTVWLLDEHGKVIEKLEGVTSERLEQALGH